MNVAEKLARKVDAYYRSKARGNEKWTKRHIDAIEEIERNNLPSGAGIDTGTTVNIEESTGERLLVEIPFHHMNTVGCYIGWQTYKATVRASLVSGLKINVQAEKPYNDNVEQFDRELTEAYLADVLHQSLTAEVV